MHPRRQNERKGEKKSKGKKEASKVVGGSFDGGDTEHAAFYISYMHIQMLGYIKYFWLQIA